VLASTDIQAAMLAFQRFEPKLREAEENDPFSVTIGTCFVISERGYLPHDDDILYPSGEIIRLQQLANECPKNLDPSAADIVFEDYGDEDYTRTDM
jgi:hypothetical protein